MIRPLIVTLVAGVLCANAHAKLAAPVLTDEAKAKAAEASAKTAHSGKVDGYKLCLSLDKTAAHWQKTAKSLGKEAKPATTTPPCADPGAFVWPAAAAASVALPTAAPVKTAAAAPSAKK